MNRLEQFVAAGGKAKRPSRIGMVVNEFDLLPGETYVDSEGLSCIFVGWEEDHILVEVTRWGPSTRPDGYWTSRANGLARIVGDAP